MIVVLKQFTVYYPSLIIIIWKYDIRPSKRGNIDRFNKIT